MGIDLDRPAPLAPRHAADPGWLGVSLGSDLPDPTIGAQKDSEGVKVIGVLRGSPAQKSGLRTRDRILSVDGKPVATPQDVIAIISALSPGSSLSLAVSRKGQERLLTPSLETRPPDTTLMRLFDGWIGVESIELPPALREHFGAPATAGVMVASVKAGGPAEAAGISVGDVVFEVDGEPFLLKARADRIEENDAGQRRIVDFKTGDAGLGPEKTHRDHGEWTDLQLPLYHLLARDQSPGLQVGFVTLPRNLDKSGYAMAEWDETELAEATEVARDVVRALRCEEFWPPRDAPQFDDGLGDLCLDMLPDRAEKIALSTQPHSDWLGGAK